MQCMWQKAGEQNKRQQSPLARAAHPVKTRRPTGFRLLPSVDLLRKMVVSVFVSGSDCGRRRGEWQQCDPGGVEKPLQYDATLAVWSFFQKMWNLVYDDKILDLAHDEEL